MYIYTDYYERNKWNHMKCSLFVTFCHGNLLSRCLWLVSLVSVCYTSFLFLTCGIILFRSVHVIILWLSSTVVNCHEFLGLVPNCNVRASGSYFFLFFSAYSYFSYFFFSNFLLFFLFFSHFTYNKQIFVRDLNILSLFKYVVYRVH